MEVQKKSSTLRRSAHQLLDTEEREILKHVMRVYRQTGSLDTLCASLSKLIVNNDKLELIYLIGDMFNPDLRKEFLRRCENRIPIFAMQRMQREVNEAMKKQNSKPSFQSQIFPLNVADSPSTIHRDTSVLNRSISTMAVTSIRKTNTPDNSVINDHRSVSRQPRLEHRAQSTPRACATVSPRTNLNPPVRSVSTLNNCDQSNGNSDLKSSRHFASQMALNNNSANIDLGDIMTRINDQITKLRPPLALLEDEGFWQKNEEIDCDLDERRRRRRSGFINKSMSKESKEKKEIRSNGDPDGKKSDDFGSSESLREDESDFLYEKRLQNDVKSASFDHQPAPRHFFTSAISDSISSQHLKSSHNSTPARPAIQITRPQNRSIVKVTTSSSPMVQRQNLLHPPELKLLNNNNDVTQDRRNKSHSESPRRRERIKEIIFRRTEFPFDVEIKGVDENDLIIQSPYIPPSPIHEQPDSDKESPTRNIAKSQSVPFLGGENFLSNHNKTFDEFLDYAEEKYFTTSSSVDNLANLNRLILHAHHTSATRQNMEESIFGTASIDSCRAVVIDIHQPEDRVNVIQPEMILSSNQSLSFDSNHLTTESTKELEFTRDSNVMPSFSNEVSTERPKSPNSGSSSDSISINSLRSQSLQTDIKELLDSACQTIGQQVDEETQTEIPD